MLHRGVDGLEGFKASVQEALYARLGTGLFDSSMIAAQLTAQVVAGDHGVDGLLHRAADRTGTPGIWQRRSSTTSSVSGPIEQFLADPDVSEMMVNALDYIYVERMA